MKDYDLFNDIEDKDIQAQKRGQVLAKILLDRTSPVDRKVSREGFQLSARYVRAIPNPERKAAIIYSGKIIKEKNQ